MVDIRVGDVNTDSILQKLQGGGLDAYAKDNGQIRIRLSGKDLAANPTIIGEALQLGATEGGGL